MDVTERLYKIKNMLKSRRVVPRQTFLDELGISPATFKRDLAVLRDRMEAPIVFDKDASGYRFDPAVADSERWELPGLWFSAEELQALLTMDRLLGELQPGVLGESLGPMRRRLRKLLESGEHSAEDVARRIRILAMGSRNVEPGHFRVLTTALLRRKRLDLMHERRADGEIIEREISPQRLVHYRDNWYLDAWCHKRQDLRTFAVDAIESVIVLDKASKDVADDVLEQHLASGYGIFGGTVTQQARLLFAPDRARWVSREVWHPKQVGTTRPDGSYQLEFPYSQEPELVMDVLKYGPDVEVLGPPSLREAVAQRLKDAAGRYA